MTVTSVNTKACCSSALLKMLWVGGKPCCHSCHLRRPLCRCKGLCLTHSSPSAKRQPCLSGCLTLCVAISASKCHSPWVLKKASWSVPQPGLPLLCAVVKIAAIHALVCFGPGYWSHWSHRVLRQRQGHVAYISRNISLCRQSTPL